MPKLKMTPTEKKLDYFPRLVKSKIELLGMKNVETLAARAGISRQTMYNRLQNPGKTTLIELLRIAEVLKFTEEEKRLIM